MNVYTFTVKGSSDNLYKIEVVFDEHNFNITCSCPAGTANQLCKHRLDLLTNKKSIIESGNYHELITIQNKFASTKLNELIIELNKYELELSSIQNKIKLLKKNISQEMIKQ